MTPTLEIRSATRLSPVGSCIYCGSADKLSDEHVVPFALGGSAILPKASCDHCAAITSAFERKVLRGFMLEARTAGSFPTRRRSERPVTVPLAVQRGGSVETVALPSTNSPGFLHLPTLEPSAFLSGRPSVTGTTVSGIETIVFGKRPDVVASALGATTIQNTVQIDVPAFVRMLAKIGYGYAVATVGLYPLSEVPVLPLILGSADDGSTWVGSSDYRLEIEAKSPQHALGLVSATTTVDGRAEEILIARVKLFASACSTGYEVVVRRRRTE